MHNWAAVLQDKIREIDFVGRLGGEEFAVTLPETGMDNAIVIAERLRKCVAEARHLSIDSGEAFNVTVSIGVATAKGGNRSIEDLLGKADAALYREKKQGKIE